MITFKLTRFSAPPAIRRAASAILSADDRTRRKPMCGIRARPHNESMAEGLRFECQPGCTACCTQKGFVYLTAADLPRMASFLGMTPAAFERRYVYRTDRKSTRLNSS